MDSSLITKSKTYLSANDSTKVSQCQSLPTKCTATNNKLRKPIRRGKKKQLNSLNRNSNNSKNKKIRILYSNANGILSKINSLISIVENENINIVALAETKCSRSGLFKIPNFNDCYESTREMKKGGGLAILFHKLIDDTCLMEKGNGEAEVIVIEINSKSIKWRIILFYGCQESENESYRKKCYQDIEVHINDCIIKNIPFLWIGDFNAKIGLKEDHHEISPNGRLVNNLIEKYSLFILNGTKLCKGVWTRIDSNGNRSILDYVISSQGFSEYVKYIEIDDTKTNTLFRTIKKGKEAKIVKSDHVSIIIEIDMNLVEDKPACRTFCWKYSEEGLNKFKTITEKNVYLDSLFVNTDKSQDTILNQFCEWERCLNSLFYQCFDKYRPTSHKSVSNNTVLSELYNQLKECEKTLKHSKDPTTLET